MLNETNLRLAPEPGASSHSELVELQRTLYESRNPTRRWLHQERYQRISEELKQAAEARSERALEVGPGSGPYIEQLCTMFDEVVATDIENEYLDHVRTEHGERPNLTLLADDIAHSAMEPASFDLILCSEVIEHTPDPAAVLKGIAALLRPGGTLVLSTPQPYSTVEVLGKVALSPGIIRLTRAIYREPVLPTGHISLLSRRELTRLVGAADLQVSRTYLSGLYVPLLAETCGKGAVALERRLARLLQNGPLSGLLWTQYWVLHHRS